MSSTTGADKPRKQEQEPASNEITEVAPGILRMQLPISLPGLGHVNCYALEDANGVAVVDPGLPGEQSWRALVQRLTAAGFPVRRVHTAVVTHSHPDHYGGGHRLREEGGARILTHRSFRNWWDFAGDEAMADTDDGPSNSDGSSNPMGPGDGHRPDGVGDLELDPVAVIETADQPGTEPTPPEPAPASRAGAMLRLHAPWARRPSSSEVVRLRATLVERGSSPLLRPPVPDRRVDHGERVVLAGREWLAVHTPGHTPDHLCLFDPTEGVVLSGDHVLPTITPHIAGIAAGVDPLQRFFTSLDLMVTLEGVTVALPAHGHPFADLAGRAEAIKTHHRERLDRLRRVLADVGPASVEELSHHLFPERSWGPMAESETYAHLEHLRLAGALGRADDAGLLTYTLT